MVVVGMDTAKTVVYAFIQSRLDYCNCNYIYTVIYGISDMLLRQLQAVQNAAARLIT